MTDRPEETPEEVAASPQNTRAQLDKNNLREKATKTWKGAWAMICGLATIGGVIGLYQFMASSSAPTNTTESLLVAMVAEGVISEEQAGNLSELLTETSSKPDAERAETVISALEDQDKDTLIAMAKTYDEDTREEGMDLLEAAAETSEDWLTIAQVSMQYDKQRSLRAAEKAVRLDRDNFLALTFLVQAQSQAGDYDRARRSAESARMLARTPRDRLMSEQAALSISISGYNKPMIEKDLERLEKAIIIYQPVFDAASFDKQLNDDEIDSHPNWLMGFIKQIQSSAEYTLERYEASRATAYESIDYFKALEPILSEQQWEKVLKREISNLNSIAGSYSKEEDFVKTAEYYRKVVAIREALVAMGVEDAEYQLATSLTYVASAEHQNDNTEVELELYARSYEIFEKLLKEDPDSETLAEMLEWNQRAIDSHSAILVGDGSEADVFKKAYDQAKIDLFKSPEDKEIQQEYFRNLQTLSGVYSSDWETFESDFRSIVQNVVQTSEQLEANHGPRLFTYELQYTAAHYLGAFEKEQGNMSAARTNFENMLHFANLLAAAPDVADFDAEERGYRVETFKLSALYNLADLDDAQALNSARAGLKLAEAWDASGQLLTREQQMIQRFKDRIAELEAEE